MYPPTIPSYQTVIAAEWPPHTVKALWISFQLDAKTAKHWWLWSLNSKSLVQLCIHTLALFPKRRGGFLTGINTENFMPLLLFGEKLPSSSSSSSYYLLFSIYNQAYKSKGVSGLFKRPCQPFNMFYCYRSSKGLQRKTKGNVKRKTTLKLKILTMMRIALNEEEGT